MRSSLYILLLVTVESTYFANQTLAISRHIGVKYLQYQIILTEENHAYNAWIQKYGLDILLDIDPPISIASRYYY
jgi:hypothetical protein